jgi:hypothetical protein
MLGDAVVGGGENIVGDDKDKRVSEEVKAHLQAQCTDSNQAVAQDP